jgi:hypothetical protein
MQKATAAPLVATASARETYRATDGRIERSADGGATWGPALADAQLSFTAAACARGGPCWFGTATGLVLRTAPTGFVRSQLPVREPVASLAPVSGLEVVAAAAGRRFRTTDGATWTEVPLQGF